MPNEMFQNGAVIDTRPDIEKAKDYKIGEVVASINPVNWIEKPETSWKRFPIFNQDGSGSCVAQTMAKLLGVLYANRNNGTYVHFSATHVYQRRANKPDGGMAGVDAFEIAKKGVTLEALTPSQNMGDSAMDSVVIEKYKDDVGKIFKIDNYLQLGTKDIDVVASVIQTTGKAVMVWFYFTHDEWTDKPIVKNKNLSLTGAGTARHSVTAVDYTLVDGKKCLIIEDSWGTSYGKAGQRIITEDFFKARNWFSAYPIDFKFEVSPTPSPVYFTLACRFVPDPALSASQQNKIDSVQHEEVVRIQRFLQQRGFFPSNATCTGYYGAVTAKAVFNWQIANGVDTANSTLKGWYWGSKSIAKANQA